MTRLFYMANNWLGWQVLAWLREQATAGADRVELVGLAVHPPERRRHGEELIAASGLPPERIFDGSRLDDPAVQHEIAELQPDLGLSVLFGYILREPLLACFERGCVNLHPSYLPWNRGAHPNVWSIIDGTPAGVTLHRIDAGIGAGVDTGDILARRRVEVAAVDTGATLYHKLERAGLALLQDSWPALLRGELVAEPQDPKAGDTHRARDLRRTDRIDLDRSYTGRELIDLLRARTFAPFDGAHFVTPEGRKVQLRLELNYEGSADEGGDA